METLAELRAAATASQELRFTTPVRPRFGGVDPLGLRQINLDLMNQVFFGLNNVARHIRPFVVVTWAWRRALELAQALDATHIQKDELQDFVDRIEVLFAASQFLRTERTDLPGSQYLAPWLNGEQLEFGGTEWRQRREARSRSTALSAPINYGPGFRMLGWTTPHPQHSGVMIPNPAVTPALDALESRIAPVLGHEAFNKFGSVAVAVDEVRQWGDLWALDRVTVAEANVMKELLIGTDAPSRRRLGGELVLAAVNHLRTTDDDRLRAAMAGSPSEFEPPDGLLTVRDKWRSLQVRQLFRLALEAFFFWTMGKLENSKRSIESLAKEFLEEVPHTSASATAGAWIESLKSPSDGPVELMKSLEQALEDPGVPDLPNSIARALAFSLTENTTDREEQLERLPLGRTREEARDRFASSVDEFVCHVLGSWVLAQHTYWSVGRGLADARERTRTILRLRVILDEGGWTLTPGCRLGTPPGPTPDRLRTVLSLMGECGLITNHHVKAQHLGTTARTE